MPNIVVCPLCVCVGVGSDRPSVCPLSVCACPWFVCVVLCPSCVCPLCVRHAQPVFLSVYQWHWFLHVCVCSAQRFLTFLKFFKGLAQSESKAHCKAGLGNPSLQRWLIKLLSDEKVLGQKLTLFDRLVFIEKEYNELTSTLFDITHWSQNECCILCVPAPFGLAEVRLVLIGRLVVVGVKYDSVGPPLAEQLTHLSKMDGPALAKKVSESGNWFSVLSPGSLLCVPSGFLLATWAAQNSTGLRWSLTVEDREDDLRVVKQVCSALMASYPALHSSEYNLWLRWLQAHE